MEIDSWETSKLDEPNNDHRILTSPDLYHKRNIWDERNNITCFPKCYL